MPKAVVSRHSGTVSMAALLALGLPAAPACAQGLAVYAQTPTGVPESLFDATPEDAATQLANQCLQDGMTVTAKEAGTITCQLPDDREAGARAGLGQAGRSGRPIFYRFQVEERGDASHVRASGWEEVPGFWGGTNERAFADPVFHNALVDLMMKAGGRLPPGTRFPNHALIGASFVARTRPEPSLEVTAVQPDSPAMRAGLQPGDLVTRIGNRRTRSLEDLNRSLVEAASAARFEIRFLREGREGVALLRSEFRPAVTAPVLAEAEEPEKEELLATAEPVAAPPVPALAAMPQPASPAPGIISPQPALAYGGVQYSGMPVMPPPGVPLPYAVPQPYMAAPYAVPQGALLPPSAAPVQAAAAAGAGDFSIADELAKFATLLKDGVITQAEFDTQKARLLAR